MKAIKSIKVCVAAGIVGVATASASFADDWTGKYVTEDTKGNPMSITLADDGKVRGEKLGHVLTGKWTNEDGAAVIKWDTGWTTMLAKDGDRYKKTAYRVGTSMEDGPTHTGSAEKIE
jgi:hypothetical protein